MPLEFATQQFRGVHCRHCSKPVRVPKIVLLKDSENHGHPVEDAHYQLISRVFVLRCRSCERESIYAIDQIVDCTLTPAPETGSMAHSAA